MKEEEKLSMEPPTFINTSINKPVIKENGSIEPWSRGEIATIMVDGLPEKYCFVRRQHKKYSFIHHSLFIDCIKDINEYKIKIYNSPDALVLYEFVNKIKLSQGCCICGYNKHHQALVFDHKLPDEKSVNITTLVKNYRRYGKKKRPLIFVQALEEMKKCVVMCANCHAIKTFNNKCGHEKLMSNYDSLDDYLIDEGKPLYSYVSLYEGEYEISKKEQKNKKIVIENEQLILI